MIFEPFIGVAPRRFDELFAAVKRKNDDGTILEFGPRTEEPRIGAMSDRARNLEVIAYTAREDFDLTVLKDRLPTLKPPLLQEEEE